MPISPPCGGSLAPVRRLRIGEAGVCPSCRARLRVVAPPADQHGDPAAGVRELRIEAHELAWTPKT
jgi:hypothetical protein